MHNHDPTDHTNPIETYNFALSTRPKTPSTNPSTSLALPQLL